MFYQSQYIMFPNLNFLFLNFDYFIKKEKEMWQAVIDIIQSGTLSNTGCFQEQVIKQ